MEIVRCKRCNRVLTSQESIKLGYGPRCFRIIHLNGNLLGPNNDLVLELVDRVRKLELDNNFMKIQLKHKVFVGKSQDSDLNWDIPKEVKEIRNEYKITFNVVVKELKVIFNSDDFDYHKVLHPINARDHPEDPPITENRKIVIENLELITN